MLAMTAKAWGKSPSELLGLDPTDFAAHLLDMRLAARLYGREEPERQVRDPFESVPADLLGLISKN